MRRPGGERPMRGAMPALMSESRRTSKWPTACAELFLFPAARFANGDRTQIGYELALRLQLLEEVVALVVDQDEGREIHDLDRPDRLHPQLRVLEDLDLLDVFFGQERDRPAGRSEIEAAVLLAGVGDLLAPIALRDHDQRPAVGLEEIDVRVHARRGRRAEGAG